MTAAELSRAFEGRRVEFPPPLRLLRPKDALEYIQIALDNSLYLIGVDGYRILESGCIEPDEKLSAGYESLDRTLQGSLAACLMTQTAD